MGKAGRVACIATPMLLTIASFVCLLLVEIAGWDNGTYNDLYFFQADFSNFTVANAGDLANSTTLTQALEIAKEGNALADIYRIHLWNYCTQNSTSDSKIQCSAKQSEFYFDPVVVWGLNATNTAAATATTTQEAGIIASYAAALKNNSEAVENEVLGKSGADALQVYRKVAKWMFIAYEVAFWTTIATFVTGLLAVCSRWGSFLTWIFSITSSLFTFAAVLTSTILFAVLVGALKGILHPYDIHLTLGTQALAVSWLAVAFSFAATLFWLFSVCCCSGRSNPHHRNNKNGLWNAEPKGQGYGGYSNAVAAGQGGRGRGFGLGGLRVEKTGGNYERVASPYLGHHGGGPAGDRVPLQDYPAPQAGFNHDGQHSGGRGFEPFRHS